MCSEFMTIFLNNQCPKLLSKYYLLTKLYAEASVLHRSTGKYSIFDHHSTVPDHENLAYITGNVKTCVERCSN